MKRRGRPTRQEAARRAEQRRRTLLGLCWNCGAGCVWATDNDGQRYMGCPNCIIVLPEPLRRAGGR